MEENKKKVVFLGDSGVGKTSIINRFSNGDFLQGQIATVGCNMTPISYIKDQQKITLNMWDTAGQERYRSIVPAYYRDSDVIVLVYSIVDLKSFEKLTSLIDEIHTKITVMPSLIIVGNKKDLEERRKVNFDDAEKFAETQQATFYECSALTNEGIDNLFNLIGMSASQSSENAIIEEKIVSLVEEKGEEKKNCC